MIMTLAAFRHAHGDDVGVRLLAHHRDAIGAVAQRTQSGDVVGVQMRVDGLYQLEFALAHELQIAVDLLQHRIDDQRLAAMPAGNEIGVSAGNAVEELAEYHRRLRSANLTPDTKRQAPSKGAAIARREKCFAPHPAGQGEGCRCYPFGCGTIRM